MTTTYLAVDFSLENISITTLDPIVPICNELVDCLKAMIDSLPEKDQEALLLTEFENLTQKELSKHLGLSISSAKSRVQRARKKLQICGDDIDCRIWIYHGKEYTAPPKAMIIEAILREVYGAPHTSSPDIQTDFEVPDNFKKFFVAMKNK